MERYDDNALRQYLLDSLDADEKKELFDELSIADDEFAWQLEAVENDLIDAYLHGELSGDELARFRSQYLASPGQREKVTFAQAFQSFAAEQINTESMAWWKLVVRRFTTPNRTL